MLDAEAIKAKLADVPGIEQLAFTLVGDRLVAAFNGITTSVAHNASEDQMIAALRNAASLRVAQLRAPGNIIDPVPELSPPPLPSPTAPAEPKGQPMASPAPGGFAAQIKAMLEGARNDLAQAKADGLAQVQEAVTEHVKAGQQVKAVAATMATAIKDETAAALAELGQISNMPPVE
jgi:hypothetical protein